MPTPPKSPLVLVVDDEEDIRSSLTMILEYEGMRIAEAASGPDALRAVEEQTPDAVLLDIKMPKIDGLTVLKKIRKDNALRCLPVIILTTSKADEDRLRSYDLGVNAYVVKPVGMENFSVAVKTINLFWELVELPSHDCGASYGPLMDTGVAA